MARNKSGDGNFKANQVGNQMRAMLRKNGTLQWRQPCVNCCQIILPVLIMLSSGILYKVFADDLGGGGGGTPYVWKNGGNTFVTGPYSSLIKYYEADASWQWYTFVNAPSESAGNLSSNGTGSGFLGNIPQGNWTFQVWNNGNNSNIKPKLLPYFEEIDSASDMDEYIAEASRKVSLTNTWNWNVNASDPIFTLPVGAVVFNELSTKSTKGPSVTDLVLDYIVQVSENTNFNYYYYKLNPTQISSSYNNIQVNLINMMTNAMIADNTDGNYTITGVFTTLYSYESGGLDLVTATSLSTFILFWEIPFALMFLMPTFIHTLVSDKQAKVLEMMKIMGLGMPSYVSINYFYFFLLYTVIAAIVVILGLAFSQPFFVQISPLAWLSLFFIWGHVQISLGFFFATLFNNQRAANIVGYLYVAIVGNIGTVLNIFVFDPSVTPPFWYMMIPHFAFIRGLWVICYTLMNVQLSPLSVGDMGPTSQLAIVFYYLIVEAIVFLLLAGYLYNVLPREYGVTYSPLFPIHMIRDRFFRRRKTIEISMIPATEAEEMKNNEDADCANERRRIHGSHAGVELVSDVTLEQGKSEDAIRIVDLRKVFSGGRKADKVAVKRFCLGIKTDECFGLLGPNGAGKSTLIQMLCGLTPPSSGDAEIAGVRISDQMHKVHQIIGYCPQHDVLWTNLTVEEHLLFYVRLKGVMKSWNELEHVRDVIRRVGLEGSGFKKSSELSGGMKRRLSIAISLVGNPSLILLDEPTTGLDPETRRGIWDVINEQKTGRSIILTTHNMEEADVLCSRIGIMSRGQLQCLGTQIYLKNKFGKGFQITVTVKDHEVPGNIDRVKNIMVNVLPKDANLESQFSGILSYQVDREQLHIGNFFNTMKTHKQEYGIAEWGINQTSLEEVFLRLIREDESTD